MVTQTERRRIYEGQGDELMGDAAKSDRLVIIPDARPTKQVDQTPRLRIMWGQLLLDDLFAGRYRSLICAVNAEDNSRGIISQLARILPTSQWTNRTITDYAQRFAPREEVTVLKYDMDAVEVLALLRPANHAHLTLTDLSTGFAIVSEMLRRRPDRLPAAAVSFLGARANQLIGADGEQPPLEAVLRTMHEAGFTGDVYPPPWMWESSIPVYARYPFPESLQAMREGGF